MQHQTHHSLCDWNNTDLFVAVLGDMKFKGIAGVQLAAVLRIEIVSHASSLKDANPKHEFSILMVHLPLQKHISK